MDIREVLKLAGRGFLVSNACINVYVLLHMKIFHVDFSLGYEFFLRVFIFSLLCSLTVFIFYSSKIISKQQMRVRTFIHSIILTSMILGLTLYWRWILPKASHILSLLVAIAVGYSLMVFGLLLKDKTTADQLNELIRARRNKKDE